MIFTGVNFNKATNSFAAVIQTYCAALVKAPQANGIGDLDALHQKVSIFINQEKNNYSKCKSPIESEVHSYMTFQVFNLIQGEDKILVSLCSRRSEYQQAFEDYDRDRISYKWPSAMN